VETKGSLNDFTDSEASPESVLGNNSQNGAVFEVKIGNSTGCEYGLKDLQSSGYQQVWRVLLVPVGAVACFEVPREY